MKDFSYRKKKGLPLLTESKVSIHKGLKGKEYRASVSLKARLGITLHEYNILFKKQEGHCAICGKEQVEQRFHADHNHKTGLIRGLLCGNCNRGIGYLKDSEVIIEKALEYIKDKSKTK